MNISSNHWIGVSVEDFFGTRTIGSMINLYKIIRDLLPLPGVGYSNRNVSEVSWKSIGNVGSKS